MCPYQTLESKVNGWEAGEKPWRMSGSNGLILSLKKPPHCGGFALFILCLIIISGRRILEQTDFQVVGGIDQNDHQPALRHQPCP